MDLKLSSDLFLGFQELSHLVEAIRNEGYEKILKQSAYGYGVVRAPSDTSFTSLKVYESSSDKVGLRAGLAIDNNMDIIYIESDAADVLTIPSDDTIRYVVISHAMTVIEKGTVNIQADGSLVGTNTEFTKRLRGGPKFASKISFPNSTQNTAEYSIQAITSDTQGALNVATSEIIAENDQEYQVVGTFTPGITVPGESKYPFEGDSYTVELRNNDTVIAGEEFILAEVKYDGVTLTIYDKRLTNKFTLADESLNTISPTNPLIGVEQITYDSQKAPQDENLVKIGWGIESLNGEWVMDASSQELTITTGKGGIWGGLAPFGDDDFNGWNVVFRSTGQVVNIQDSIKSGTSVRLQLDFLSSYPTTGDISVVPSCDSVEITVTNATNPTANKRIAFPANSRYGIFKLQSGTQSTIRWRHITRDQSTVLALIVDGNYINETSFDSAGTFITENRTLYFNGLIRPLLSGTNMYDTLIPGGLICMWGGDLYDIPSGWHLCNGDNSTPDLRGKFVVHYDPDDSDYDGIGNSGGMKTVTLTEDQIPGHTHTGTAEGGDHSHEFIDGYFAEKNSDWLPPAGYGIEIQETRVAGSREGFDEDNVRIFYKNRTTSLSGDLSIPFTTASTGGGNSHENRPPFYTLAFIMKAIIAVSPEPVGAVGNIIDVTALQYYKNDGDAATGGIEIGGLYKVAKANTMGMAHGALKTREV